MAMEVFHDSNSGTATESKVQFLSQPTSYADCPSSVETIETHMSWVFLTDQFVYKLKKPVRYEFLDFSTLDARYRDCEAELHLNRSTRERDTDHGVQARQTELDRMTLGQIFLRQDNPLLLNRLHILYTLKISLHHSYFISL